ncbi:MAG: pitrilysin family protein [Bacteroidota bacterium]|nr:pitrilysin family protein [Bacteroidota bacterium]
MSIINRKQKPPIFEIAPDRKVVELIVPKVYTLDNGLKVYVINAGTQELVNVEFVFNAGIWHQDHLYVATSTNSLMKEGTQNMTARQIADELDYYGAYHDAATENDSAFHGLFTLNKYLPATLKVMEEIIKRPIFDQNEVDIYLRKRYHSLLVKMEKVDFLARIHFTGLLYGPQHPYGRFGKAEEVLNVNREDLVAFHKKFYRSSNCQILVSGKVEESVIDLLNQYFGGDDWDGPVISEEALFEIQPAGELFHHIEKPDALQSALRIGKVLFNRRHPDFPGMHVLNTILGGYFGSRLMTNIREDKGLTYGIGSGLVLLRHSGYFYISSEVGADVADVALDEIFKEIALLQKVPVTSSELKKVRNYLGGTFLRAVDGPFNLIDRFREIHENNLDIDHYYRMLETIQKITPDEIMELANRYLSVDSLYRLKVGK